MGLENVNPPAPISRYRRRKVHAAVQKALRDGALIRSSCCDHCGGSSPDRDLDGHHHNGYSDEHILDLIWLCRSCHQRIHPPRLNKPHSEEIKQRISASLRKSYAEGKRTRPDLNGEKNPFFGKKHSPEAREKMSKAARSRS